MKKILKAMTLLVFMLVMGILMIVPVVAQSSTIGAQQATWSAVFYDTTTPGTGNSEATTLTGLNRTFSGSPIDGIPADSWSARFSTTVTFTTGLWQFNVLANDGVRVLINGNVVIDAFSNVGTTTQTNTVNLTGGQYSVVVELVDRDGDALIQVNWAETSTGGGTGGGGTGGGGTGTGGGTVTTGFANARVSGVNGLAVRTGPFLGASLIAVARPGPPYPVLGLNRQEGLFTWYLIQFDNDTQGWVSGRYLIIEAITTTGSSCVLDAALSLSIIQTLYSAYQNGTVAFQCVNAVATNTSNAAAACTPIVNEAATFGITIGLTNISTAYNTRCPATTTTTNNVPTISGTDFDKSDNPPGRVIGVTRSVMNFRLHPSHRVGRVGAVPQLEWGAEVEIIARTVQGGRDFWYQVLYTPEGSNTTYMGWIFAAYVGVTRDSDPIDSVPIR